MKIYRVFLQFKHTAAQNSLPNH